MHRRRGEVDPLTGNNDFFWPLPSIYFGDYLEVSTNDDEVEAPLSWREYEFQVKNPEGQKSKWVLFTYPFDYKLLKSIQCESLQLGMELLGMSTGPMVDYQQVPVVGRRLVREEVYQPAREADFLQGQPLI
ncbi:hypothetical protein DCMF_07040 [Candidatus Formimonas warabiya]|uniref:Uncharacterized protein n=1 Tax=Formimonas warabiya TaxID=1761012 RepID=A0A3G1KQ25_FORW1|nr:hypothetical protein DCMF_07040 [Candidatus Formimonas warabiya]